MTAPTRQAQRAERLTRRLDGILASLTIDVGTVPEEPQQAPVTALELADRRIPARYHRAVADHPDVLAWASEITRRGRPGPGGTTGIANGPSLLIAGPTGTGKTHQAYGAVRTLLAAGVRLRWAATNTADLHAQLRPRQGHDPERVFQDLAHSPLLILDDLGAAKQTEWTEELTYRLIDRRYTWMLPTLITTNVPIPQLREALGDRVASRLAEMTTRVILQGPDRRRTPVPATVATPPPVSVPGRTR
ncbi:ATP-binding protein [Streptomyces sp. CB03234]|uniref:ATP-binding protein n=1 Tax=Streptomyces sp. (strain CB03234) TaxID=1703937 RepID=UPI00093BD5A7|nr:ATP-binding protein [Streptomyces sp. CB03234]OKK02626.1 ATP-binding protein [Streptomyces sp. CB03234]